MNRTTQFVVVLLLAFTSVMNAHVGIGTTNPKALLQIHADSTVTDNQKGNIIPTVSTLPINEMGLEKKGMLVFLENGSSKGYYFYDGN